MENKVRVETNFLKLEKVIYCLMEVIGGFPVWRSVEAENLDQFLSELVQTSLEKKNTARRLRHPEKSREKGLY